MVFIRLRNSYYCCFLPRFRYISGFPNIVERSKEKRQEDVLIIGNAYHQALEMYHGPLIEHQFIQKVKILSCSFQYCLM